MLCLRLRCIHSSALELFSPCYVKKSPAEDSLWSVGHAEGRQVSVGEGEQGHDGDEGAVVTEDDGESGVLHVAQHEQRDEDQTRQHGAGEQNAVLRRLRKHRRSRSGTETEKETCLMQAADSPIGRETGCCDQPGPWR